MCSAALNLEDKFSQSFLALPKILCPI